MNRIKIFINSGQSIAGKSTKERVNRCWNMACENLILFKTVIS